MFDPYYPYPYGCNGCNGCNQLDSFVTNNYGPYDITARWPYVRIWIASDSQLGRRIEEEITHLGDKP